ncbi:MAG: type II toxin-antitoxin system VapC family toxin [Cyclobacteriaceae bacterium]|nr:type II toxin-antitoxin system VapC family toxin [Cyclobacteriaceae bacterium]
MPKTGNNGYLLDTNIVIDLFKGQRDIADKINESGNVYLPIPTLGELYLGAENSGRRTHHFRQIDALLQIIEIINTSQRTAEMYGILKVKLKRLGKPIPENDIWIAALAKEHDYTIVSRDKHFNNIPDLVTIPW